MSKPKKNKKYRIDWLNHSLEFFVVVIGILLAFQLNKCSSENNQQKVIDSHLQQIIEETEFNKKSFERAVDYGESQLLKIDTAFMLMAQKGDLSWINQISLELLDLGGVYIRKNAYQALVESGDIRFMKSIEQKRKIIDLYEYYKWVEAFDEISMNLYTSDYYPYLKNNFDLVNGNTQKEEVYYSKIFQNILGAYSRTSSNRVQKYKDCLKEIEAYLK